MLYSVCSNINYDNYDIYTQYIKEFKYKKRN